MLVLMAQASWKAWKLTASIFRLPAGATCRQRPHWLQLFDVQVQLVGLLLVLHDGAEGAGVDDLLADGRVRALLGEPVGVEVHGVVHGAAGLAGHAAQGQVLDRAAVSRSWGGP